VKELQRFPRLHAQLVEVVSELLRERLGPTSEYAQSLIAIQAAYINTNHPEFVAGSAAIARDGAGPQQPTAINAPSVASTPEDASDSGDDEVASAPPNGQVGHGHHPRSVSASVNDLRQRPHVPKHLDAKDRNHHRTASGGHGALAPPPVPTALSVGGSPHTAKDTFLNYFFGGPGGPGGPGQNTTQQASSSSQHRQRQQPSSITQKEMLPDLGTGRRRGQAGIEGGSTAFHAPLGSSAVFER
jgi:dynamin 1-like protein